MKTIPAKGIRYITAATLAAVLIAFSSGCTRAARAARYVKQADDYYRAGDYERAQIECRNALQKDPTNGAALTRMGAIFFDQGKLGAAFAATRRAVEFQPDNLEARLLLARLKSAAGMAAEARKELRAVLAKNPADPVAIVLLAEIASQPDDIAESRKVLENLPAAAASKPALLVARGVLDVRERRSSEAEQEFKEAQTLDPKFAAASSALGFLYWKSNDLPNAEKAFAAAAAASPARSPQRLQHAQFLLRTDRPEESRQMLEAMTRNTPDFLPPFVVLAELAMSERRYADCVSLLDKVLARDRFHVEALALSARARLETGEIDAALASLERAVKVNPQAAQLHYQLGLTYLAKGDAEKATASLTQAAKVAPGIPVATLALAELNLRRGEAALAITALKQLTEQHPAILEGWTLLAKAYHGQGKLDDALKTYRYIEKSTPPSASTSFFIGLVLEQQKNIAEARQQFEKSAQLRPNYLLPVEQLVNLDLAAKQYPSARQRVADYVARNPAESGARMLQARVDLASGDLPQAETALRKAIELQPNAVDAYLVLAQILGAGKQSAQAAATLQTAVERNPQDIRPILELAMFHRRQDDFARAREYYEKALALDPNSGAALNNLAYLYTAKFDNLDKALELAQRARDLFPHQPHIADTLGWVLYLKGQYARAVTFFEDSAAKLPQNAEVAYHLGMAHYMMGEETAARTSLERSLKAGDSFADAEEARRCLAILNIDPKAISESSRALLQSAITTRKNDPIALCRMAGLFEADGQVEKAVTAYEGALKANPSNVSAALSLVRLYQARNENAKALELAKAIRKQAPADGQVARALGRVAYDLGDYPWSASLLEEARRKNPEDAEVQFEYAEAAYSIGQVSIAGNALRDALEIKPLFTRAAQARRHLELIALADDADAAKAAAKIVEDALKSDPRDLPSLMARGVILEKNSDVAAAKQNYEKILSRFQDFSPAQKRLAILYAAQAGNEEKAAEMATKARKAFPTDPELAKAFGITLFRQGNYARAITLLQESSRSRTSDAELLYYLGMTQHQLKDKNASERALKRSLELGLGDQLAAEAGRVLAANH